MKFHPGFFELYYYYKTISKNCESKRARNMLIQLRSNNKQFLFEQRSVVNCCLKIFIIMKTFFKVNTAVLFLLVVRKLSRGEFEKKHKYIL